MKKPLAIADQEFSNPRLASVYDALAGERDDLTIYRHLINEFTPSSLVDIGCGTGTLLSTLADDGLRLVGVDPAEASLNVARNKVDKNQVLWVLGGTESITSHSFDMALMTGNVAQVFLTDAEWTSALADTHRALAAGGVFIFEARNPKSHCWEKWDRSNTHKRVVSPSLGLVESWCDVTDVSLPFVSFQWSFVFEADGAVLTSQSTIRFRTRGETETSLRDAGFKMLDVREPISRFGEALVYIANPCDE